jgi:hypothetical protein
MSASTPAETAAIRHAMGHVLEEVVQRGWLEHAGVDAAGNQLYRPTEEGRKASRAGLDMAQMLNVGVYVITMAAQISHVHDELRANDIHLGLGPEPRCVVCDEHWPCTVSRQSQ